MRITGMVISSLTALSCPKSLASVMPLRSAFVAASCIAGPSAMGSLNGIPISTMSMPWRCIALRVSAVLSGAGHPAQK